MAKNIFGPEVFPSVVVPFQSKKVGRFFGPWTIQENGFSLLCDVISMFHWPTKLRAIIVEKGYSVKNYALS